MFYKWENSACTFWQQIENYPIERKNNTAELTNWKENDKAELTESQKPHLLTPSIHCSGSNKKHVSWALHLNTWSPASGAVWGDLGGMTLLKEVVLGGGLRGFEVLSHPWCLALS